MPRRTRRSSRLQGYDYAQAGAYFVTLCTHQRALLFGSVRGGAVMQSTAGVIAAERWAAIPQHHPHVALDAFVVMPNHIHGILVITDHLVGTTPALSDTPANRVHSSDRVGPADRACPVPTTASLSTVIGSYKSGVTRRVRHTYNAPDLMVWQGRFYDHIIRHERALNNVRAYIQNNPARWTLDRYHPDIP